MLVAGDGDVPLLQGGDVAVAGSLGDLEVPHDHLHASRAPARQDGDEVEQAV